MAEVRYKTVGTSVMTPTAMTRRKEILVPMVLTDYTLLYHYGDLDQTPVRNATFLATLSNGEKRTGVLDDTGRAQLCGVPKGPVSVTYQHDAPDSDDADIVAARDKIRQALDAIVAQTRLDMADEWKEWNEAGWLKRQYLETINTAQGGAVGAWHWLSGAVDTVWQLGVLLYKFDKEKREINRLFFTGQWAELDKKLASYRAKGVQVLGEASEVKELLNLIFHDQKTRELIASFAGRWWAAIPPDEQRELVASGGMQIIIDVVIGVLLAAFTAGAAGAAYGSAKWAAAAGRLGARLTRLLDKLKESFELLAKALRVRKRRTTDLKKRANGAKTIETTWKPVPPRPPSNYSPPLKSRHSIRSVRQGGVKKAKNTVAEPRIDMNADVASINRGEGTQSGSLFTTNGRTYELIDGDHLVPHSGPGFHNLDRGEFDALGVFNKFGDTEQAGGIARKVAGEAGASRALQVWRLGQ